MIAHKTRPTSWYSQCQWFMNYFTWFGRLGPKSLLIYQSDTINHRLN